MPPWYWRPGPVPVAGMFAPDVLGGGGLAGGGAEGVVIPDVLGGGALVDVKPPTGAVLGAACLVDVKPPTGTSGFLPPPRMPPKGRRLSNLGIDGASNDGASNWESTALPNLGIDGASNGDRRRVELGDRRRLELGNRRRLELGIDGASNLGIDGVSNLGIDGA